MIVAGAIVIYYLTKTPVATRSGGLAFELALAALGIVLGLAAGLMFRVFRDRGIPWSRAGVAYALLWIVVVGARIGFAEAASRSHSVQVWLGTHHITSDAVTDALIFMAVGMLLTRTATLRLRAAALPADGRAPSAPSSRPQRHGPPTCKAPAERSHHGSPHRRLAGIPVGIVIAAMSSAEIGDGVGRPPRPGR